MDNIKRNTKIIDSLLSRDRSYLSPNVKAELDTSDMYTDFVLGVLIRSRKYTAKIDQMLLFENGLFISLDRFLEKEYSIKCGFVDVIKKDDKYIKLKINIQGIEHFKSNSIKYKIKSITDINRITRYMLKLNKKLISLVFVSANNKIKSIIESGIIKLILFVIAIITFILKWDDVKKLIHKITE